MINDKSIQKHVSSGGVTVYKLPVEAFPNHVTNCYLVMDDPVTLLDTGSGWEQSNADLQGDFDRLAEEFDESVTLKDVGRVIITHGHIDHFGGLNFVAEHSGAEVGIHALDSNVIQNFRERLLVSSTNLHIYLNRSGLSEKKVNDLLEMNKWSKGTFHTREIDFMIGEGQILDSPMYAYHAPGHCPGQVCIQLHDILFTADHVLSRITPNQSPESITRYNGVGHYIEALKKIRQLEGVRIGLGGHELEMEDLGGRIDDTLTFHDSRLNKTLEILAEPCTVADVSKGLFGKQVNYHVMLALMESGAHLEYLYERGQVVVTNVDEVEKEFNPVLIYQRR